jgi:hypothetical protein
MIGVPNDLTLTKVAALALCFSLENWQPEPRRTKTFSRDATTMLSRLDPRILQGFGPKKDA